ncbi:MAG: hypothetical protein JO033_01025 [Acidobacteriaceae bacterium]|nr:hypothetical protein [Acidobacteriaceae bacterium]MBV9501370.1 hypothetical protein [Acidobacteriaceae bacterium]
MVTLVATEIIPLPSSPNLPALITQAGKKAAWRFLEFFTVNIRTKTPARPTGTGRAHSRAGARAGGLRASRTCSRCMSRAKNDQQHRHCTPDPDHVMPIPLACSSAQSRSKGDRRAGSFRTPLAQASENYADENQAPKRRFGTAANQWPTFLDPSGADCPMKPLDYEEECMHTDRAETKHSTAVRVDINYFVPVD